MVQWKNAAEISAPWLRVFLCGPTGSGKTLSASTFPLPVFLCPANEDSIETLRGLDMPFAVLGEGAGPVRKETEDVLTQFLASAKKGAENFHEEFGKTIVFESLAHYQDLVLKELQALNLKDSRQVWGLYLNHFTQIRDALWQLPAHVVLTTLDDTRTDDSGRVIEIGPMMSGKARKLIPSSCHILGFCEQRPTNPPQWVTHVCSYKGFAGRSRLSGFPNGSYGNFGFDTIQQYVPNLLV